MEISFIPKCVLSIIPISDEQKIDLDILLSSFLLLFLFFPLINFISLLPHVCLFQEAFGMPCPACGILRSICYLSNMDIIASIHSNALGLILVAYIILQIPLRLVSLFFPITHQTFCNISKTLSRAFILLLLSLWVNKLFTIL